MTLERRRKIMAFILVILLVSSTVVGYFVFWQKPVVADQDNGKEEKVMTVTDTGPSLGLFTYGPPQGYEPLTVRFYANPENDSNIKSYHWDFGPEKWGIISESSYTAILHKPIIRLLEIIFGLSIVGFIGSGFNFGLASSMFTAASISGLLTALVLNLQIRKNRQFVSEDRAPSMMFLDYGSYSAKLTVIYKNDTTASQTAWITVFQYVPPDRDYDNDSMTLRQTLLNRYISRRTWTQIGD
jgi:hypothetical protein